MSARFKQIQRMFSHIGEDIRFLLQRTTYTYHQNSIDYSVIDFHQKIIRLIAPPFQILGFSQQQQQFKEQQHKINDFIPKQGEKTLQNSNRQLQTNFYRSSFQKQQPRMPYLINRHENQYQTPIDSSYWKSYQNQARRIFIGNNPTGVYRQIKQYQQSKGQFVKKSMKTIRHINKFIMNYEQNQARKNDPNRIRKRKPKKPKQQNNQQPQDDDASKKAYNGKKGRGRKVEDWSLQQNIYTWVKDQVSKGKKIRKVDIRNKFRVMSEGKFTGSTGWCRRFIQRHPQVKQLIKINDQPQKKLISLNNPTITKNKDQIRQWIQVQKQQQSDFSSFSQNENQKNVGNQYQQIEPESLNQNVKEQQSQQIKIQYKY